MGNIIYIPCSNCGKLLPRSPYRAKRSKHHFCNISICRANWLKNNSLISGGSNPRWGGGVIEVPCDNCGNILHRKKSAISKHNFCNQKCVAAWKSKQSCNDNTLIEGGKVCVPCSYCGGDVIKKASHVRDLNFCNRKCQANWRKEHKSGEDSPKWKERVKLVCDNCGEVIHRMDGDIRDVNFCDMYCFFEWRCGENSPNWNGGVSFGKYCKKFNENFKRRVRLFFNNTCVVCGTTYIDGKNMDVHHVNYNPSVCCDNDLPLFVTLCHSCHTKTNRKSDRERWSTIFTEIIYTKYGGKCYLTKKEYKDLMRTKTDGQYEG